MPTIINPKLTTAGLTAAVNASGTGTQISITHVVLGSGKFNPTASSVIQNRREKMAIAGGFVGGTGNFRVTVFAPSYTGTAYDASEIGFYAGDPDAGGILFAIHSHPADVIVVRNSLDYMAQFSLQLTQVPAGSVTVTIDPSAAQAAALISAHELAGDPHPQYSTTSEVNALIEARVGDYVTTTNTGNAYTVVLDPAITAYTSKTSFTLKLSATNTGSATLNAGAGALAFNRDDGTAMQSGDLLVGSVIAAVYDTASATFRAVDSVQSQAQALITAHVALSDPHTQYAKKASPVFTGQVFVPDGALAGPGIVFSESANDTGFYHPGDGVIKVANNAVNTVTLQQALVEFHVQVNVPTASPGTNTTQAASTAFVQAANPDASTTAKGKVQLANTAEAQALTDAAKAITPATLAAAFQGANNLFSGNGYQRLPGGLIIQWMTVAAADDTYAAYSFPIQFPNAGRLAVATPIYMGAVGGGNVLGAHVGSVSTTAVSVGQGGNSVAGSSVYVLAIGN